MADTAEVAHVFENVGMVCREKFVVVIKL